MEERRFYAVLKGKPEGPFTLDELKALALKKDDFVKVQGEVDYLELQEHSILSTLLKVDYRKTRPQYFASLDIRLLAWFLDFLLIFAVYCIFWALPVLLMSTSESRIPLLIQGSWGIPLVLWIEGVICEQGALQGTPGKRLLKIKVSDTAGNPITLGSSLLRNLFKGLGFLSLGILFFIGFLDRRQQCLHDKIAGTLVIKNRLLSD